MKAMDDKSFNKDSGDDILSFMTVWENQRDGKILWCLEKQMLEKK